MSTEARSETERSRNPIDDHTMHDSPALIRPTRCSQPRSTPGSHKTLAAFRYCGERCFGMKGPTRRRGRQEPIPCVCSSYVQSPDFQARVDLLRSVSSMQLLQPESLFLPHRSGSSHRKLTPEVLPPRGRAFLPSTLTTAQLWTIAQNVPGGGSSPRMTTSSME